MNLKKIILPIGVLFLIFDAVAIYLANQQKPMPRPNFYAYFFLFALVVYVWGLMTMKSPEISEYTKAHKSFYMSAMTIGFLSIPFILLQLLNLAWQ